MVPESRIDSFENGPVRDNGDFVLYWMIAFRRASFNFALERAVEWAAELGKPLVILEALGCEYPWASDRLSRFVLDGMRDNAERFVKTPVLYYPYVEPAPAAGKGLLAELGRRACVVVTDDFPAFVIPRLTAAAARTLPVRLERVDANGLFPMRSADRLYPTAHAFRRMLHKHLRESLAQPPKADPLADVPLPERFRLSSSVMERWPAAAQAMLRGEASELAKLPLDHTVGVVATPGGSAAATKQGQAFLKRLSSYDEDRNHPDRDATSGLSPYLHFGHLSTWQVFLELAREEEWSPDRLGKPTGSKSGWWGMSDSAEAFLDQIVTWREVGFNGCVFRDDYDRYESLPNWAIETLADHADDPREAVYSLEQFEAAQTHDPLWNAAQTQLVREGRLHNYLRMLWGKKILEWSPTPQDALATMIELNNKYALDGRDPNSYSGIFWTLGRYDRPWGPERPIFGKVRYMSSANTARKLLVKEYLKRYSPQ